jgi:hypothetical protein
MTTNADDLELSGYAASDIETGYAASDIETGAAEPEARGVGVFDPGIDALPLARGTGKFFMARTTAGRFYACVHATSDLGDIQLCLQLSPGAAAKLLSPAPAAAPVAVGWMSPNEEVTGFNLFHAVKDAATQVQKAGDFFKIPGWNVTTSLLTGHNPIEGLKRDVQNFQQAGQLAQAVVSGNYGQAWDLATNGGKIFHPDIPAPPGRDYHRHALWHDHPEALAYHRALIAPPTMRPAPPSVGWMGPAQSVVGYALDHEPGTLEHDASPVVRSLGRVADKAAAAIAEAARHHNLDHETHDAARLVARAHLGDHNAQEFIREATQGARAGHPEHIRRAQGIARASRFVARHVDLPRILAGSIPIPAVQHVAQSGIGLSDPNVRFAHSVEALRRGDVASLRTMADQELAEMRGVVSLVPGIGSGVRSAMGTGEHLLQGGHSLEEALRAAYGAIPVPAEMRHTTDIVLEAVFALVRQPHALTDGSLAIVRDRIPSGVPRDVYDTLVHVVAKHQPIGRDVENLRGHYVRHFTQGLKPALDHGMRNVVPRAVAQILGRLPDAAHQYAQVNPGLKHIAHVAADLRAGIAPVGPPSGQIAPMLPAAPTTGARGYRGRGGHGGYRPHAPYARQAYAQPLPPLYGSDDGADGSDEDGDESTGFRSPFGHRRAFAHPGFRHRPPSFGHRMPAYIAPPIPSQGDGGDAGGGDDGADGSDEDGDESTGFRWPFGHRRTAAHRPHPGFRHRPAPPFGHRMHPYIAPPQGGGQQPMPSPQGDMGGGDAGGADAGGSDAGDDGNIAPAEQPAQVADQGDADELAQTNAEAAAAPDAAADESAGFAFVPALLGAAAGAGALYGYQRWSAERAAHTTAGEFDMGDPETTGLGVIIPGTYHPELYESTAGEFDMGDPETTGAAPVAVAAHGAAQAAAAPHPEAAHPLVQAAVQAAARGAAAAVAAAPPGMPHAAVRAAAHRGAEQAVLAHPAAANHPAVRAAMPAAAVAAVAARPGLPSPASQWRTPQWRAEWGDRPVWFGAREWRYEWGAQPQWWGAAEWLPEWGDQPDWWQPTYYEIVDDYDVDADGYDVSGAFDMDDPTTYHQGV